jgi:hypothetical protein
MFQDLLVPLLHLLHLRQCQPVLGLLLLLCLTTFRHLPVCRMLLLLPDTVYCGCPSTVSCCCPGTISCCCPGTSFTDCFCLGTSCITWHCTIICCSLLRITSGTNSCCCSCINFNNCDKVSQQYSQVPLDGTIFYDPDHCAFSAVPSSYRVDLADDKWRFAMEAKFHALQARNTWTLVPKPPGQNVISCKWVFRVKENSDGSIDKLKAQLVARSFTQQYGIDYMETFSPVVKPTTVRLVLSLAVFRGWDIRQIDISNAFLHVFLDESAYMQQPPGFQDPSRLHHVCKLSKAIYGLK